MGRPHASLRYLQQNVGMLIIYLRQLYASRDLPPLDRNSYSTWEGAQFFNCDDDIIRGLAYDGQLPYVKDQWGEIRIFLPGMVSFLRKRSRGIRRPFEEVLADGMTPTPPVARVADIHLAALNYLIRTEKIPSINISRGEKPHYRLPLLDTCQALEKLMRELRKPRQPITEHTLQMLLGKG